MYNQAARLTRNQVQRLLGGFMLCLTLSLTVACQQTDKKSSNNSQEETVQSANPKNSQGIPAIPQRRPGEVTVNLPTPFPSTKFCCYGTAKSFSTSNPGSEGTRKFYSQSSNPKALSSSC